MLTDDAGCIVVQTNERAPLWLYLADEPADALRRELVELIGERLRCFPALKVNVQERFARDVLW